jgi:hypothetical protein
MSSVHIKEEVREDLYMHVSANDDEWQMYSQQIVISSQANLASRGPILSNIAIHVCMYSITSIGACNAVCTVQQVAMLLSMGPLLAW